MNSRQNEDDRVQRLLSLLDLATEPEPSDHVDDDTLALLAGGRASAEELAAVRAHLVVCPPCRRLVGQILSDTERSRSEVLPARTWGWIRRAPAILAWAVAACLLLGVTVVIWSLNRGGGCAETLAPTRPRRRPALGGAAGRAGELGAQRPSEASSRNGPQSPSRSTRRKTASRWSLMVANGHWELLRGERPMKKGPGNDYGPIESPPAPVVFIVVLSDRQERGELSRTIRESLPSEPRDIEAHYQTWRDDVRARLTRGGHRWVSVEPMRVVPAKPDPAERPAPASQPGPLVPM